MSSSMRRKVILLGAAAIFAAGAGGFTAASWNDEAGLNIPEVIGGAAEEGIVANTVTVNGAEARRTVFDNGSDTYTTEVELWDENSSVFLEDLLKNGEAEKIVVFDTEAEGEGSYDNFQFALNVSEEEFDGPVMKNAEIYASPVENPESCGNVDGTEKINDEGIDEVFVSDDTLKSGESLRKYFCVSYKLNNVEEGYHSSSVVVSGEDAVSGEKVEAEDTFSGEVVEDDEKIVEQQETYNSETLTMTFERIS